MCDSVVDLMKVHTRPYVTPLVQDVVGVPPVIGTGTFIERDGIELVTCEHVSRYAPFEHEFFGREGLLKLPVQWRSDPPPIDAAIAPFRQATGHRSAIRRRRFRWAGSHRTIGRSTRNCFSFGGFAGQNVLLQIGHSRLTATGYCSQEMPGGGDPNIFEMLWHPPATTVSSRTSAHVRSHFQHNDPGGFSGSLVWNTRFVEQGSNLATGLLRTQW